MDDDLVRTALRVLEASSGKHCPADTDVRVLREAVDPPERGMDGDELAVYVVQRELRKRNGAPKR